MKPSKRIMEIYQEELKKQFLTVATVKDKPAFLQKIYCDSIVQYLDESLGDGGKGE